MEGESKLCPQCQAHVETEGVPGVTFGADFEIRIVGTKDGKINVHGPLDNRMLMYAVLECVRDTVSNLHAMRELQKQMQGVRIPTPNEIQALTGR